jgi:hypothetical protein
MAKLFKLKEWVTLPEAAKHLSNILEEEVAESDLLRLALNGHLKLSVNFVNGAHAKCGKVVPYERAKMYISSTDKSVFPLMIRKGVYINDELPAEIEQGLHDKTMEFHPMGIVIRENEILELEETVYSLFGVYDLPMIGAERLDVEHQFQQETGGPKVELANLDGAFVEGKGGLLYQLQERFYENEYFKKDSLEKNKKRLAKPLNSPENFYPAGGLPTDNVLVVRTAGFTEFCDQIGRKEAVTPPLRESQRHLERCRALAEWIWQSTPDMTISDMVRHDAINAIGCENRLYVDGTIRNWIKDLCPNPKPGRPKSSSKTET